MRKSKGVFVADETPQKKETKFAVPAMTAYAATSRGRHSGGSSIGKKGADLSGLLCNIDAGVTPFSYENGDVDCEAAIKLCQKAYWNIAIFKQTIDIMSEFANSKLHFRGQNKASNTFYEEWWKKIGGWDVGDQFYRELLRSSNVFWYRVEGDMIGYKKKSLAKIPVRYILLNPADIRCESAASFVDGSYKKVLNEFEVKVLKNSKDPKNLALKKALPKKVQDDIEKGVASSIPLDPDTIIPIFFKKQDYEGLAMPMYFPVLFDLNLKLEFKKAEQIIAKACEYMILLINLGSEEHGTDEALVEATENLFKVESVGRVLVSDWSTKMEFIMPDLAKILGPEKYVSVNQDIANGLMNIFFGENKFADSMVKIKVFLERINEARKIFLNKFLIPEMERIAEAVGFREIPTPEFEEVDIKDELEYYKVYTRLAELGLLTADEMFTAFKTHILPESYDSIVSQEDFKKKKDKGLYAPIVPEKDEGDGGDGRPKGKAPKKNKTKKSVKPAGASIGYSLESYKEVVLAADTLIDSVVESYKNSKGIVRASKKHREMARMIAFNIIQNESRSNWDAAIPEYLADPMKTGPEYEAVAEIAEEHGLDFLGASLLHHTNRIEIV